MEMTDLREQQTTPSKEACLGVYMAAELIIGFLFGILVILVVKMVNSLDHCVEELMSRK